MRKITVQERVFINSLLIFPIFGGYISQQTKTAERERVRKIKALKTGSKSPREAVRDRENPRAPIPLNPSPRPLLNLDRTSG